jgi:hypothetical protein
MRIGGGELCHGHQCAQRPDQLRQGSHGHTEHGAGAGLSVAADQHRDEALHRQRQVGSGAAGAGQRVRLGHRSAAQGRIGLVAGRGRLHQALADGAQPALQCAQVLPPKRRGASDCEVGPFRPTTRSRTRTPKRKCGHQY